MIFKSGLKWQYTFLAAFMLIFLLPLLTWNYFLLETDVSTINWLTWQNILPIVITTVILYVMFRSGLLMFGLDEGFLRLTLELIEDADGNKVACGQLFGRGTSKYLARGYKVILYIKRDYWWLEGGDSVKVSLGYSGSWRMERIQTQNISMYAAFLVQGNYHPPRVIRKNDPADLPPLSIDGKQIVTWMPYALTSDSPTERNQAKAINWLKQQITPNKIVPHPHSDKAGLIISYHIPNHDKDYLQLYARSWLYDNASAAIGFIINEDLAEALMILKALSSQIQEDGKFDFSYNTNNDWYCEDFQSGAIAWAGYAFTFYYQATGDDHLQPIAERIARYLLSLQNLNAAEPGYGSIRTSPTDFSYAADLNIYAYFFLRDMGRLTNKSIYIEGVSLIQDALCTRHWNETLGCFNQKIGAGENGLIEVATLGALFSIAIGDLKKAQSSLEFAEQIYRVSLPSGLVEGYAPYKDYKTVWCPGSIQMALAYKRLGDDPKGSAILNEIIKEQCIDGSIPYAIPRFTAANGETFPEWPSVAGAAWLILALANNKRLLMA